jgi:hypothetical protein
MYPSEDCPYCERVTAAAAEVGEQSDARISVRAAFEEMDKHVKGRDNATIERCAQVAEDKMFHHEDDWRPGAIAAAIRALKDK